jgi:DNA-binding helix-hairpin-helix protein with protein kinase domain
MAKTNVERQQEYRRRKREQREQEIREALGKPANWHPDARTWGALGNALKKQRAIHYREHKIGDVHEDCPWCARESP